MSLKVVHTDVYGEAAAQTVDAKSTTIVLDFKYFSLFLGKRVSTSTTWRGRPFTAQGSGRNAGASPSCMHARTSSTAGFFMVISMLKFGIANSAFASLRASYCNKCTAMHLLLQTPTCPKLSAGPAQGLASCQPLRRLLHVCCSGSASNTAAHCRTAALCNDLLLLTAFKL